MSKGGLVVGPSWICGTNPITYRFIREIEPGLIIVSICGGPPEYVISADWARRHGRGALRSFDAMLRRESEIWENEGGQLLSGANERG